MHVHAWPVGSLSVAFFRNLNLGQRRSHSPTRPQLLEGDLELEPARVVGADADEGGDP